jgi:hypothetical protein
MTRRLLAVLGVMTAAFVLVARAEQPLPVKVDAKKSVTAPRIEEGDPRIRIEDAANQQERLKRQFDDFKQSLINLANRLEKSGKQEDRDKAANLKLAIKKAGDEGVDTKFATLVDALRRENAYGEIEKLDEILTKNDELRKDIRSILELLLKDNRDEELRKEIERNAKLLEEIKRIIAQQEKVIAKNYGRTKTEDVLKSQKGVTKNTENLIEGKKGDQGNEAKKGEGKDSKGGKEGVGEAKEDTKGPKGESRDGKEGKEGKQGEGKDGKGSEGKDGKAGEGKDGKEGKDGAGKEGKEGEGKDGKGGEGKDGKQGEGKEGKDGKSGEGKDGKGGEGKDGKAGEGKDGKQGEGKEGKGGEGKEGKAGEGKDGKGGEGKDGKSGEGKEGKGGEGKEGKPGEGKEGKPGDGKPGEGKQGAKPGEGKPGSKSGSGKPSDSKAGQGKPGEGKSGDSKGKGEGKGDAKGGKPGEGKAGSGKPGESKSGQSGQSGQQGQQGEAKQGGQQGGQKGGQQGGQQPPQDNPVKKQIQDANKYQKQAEQDLEKEKRADAGKNEEEAKEKLEAARKKLEDLLKQLREEEIERLLAALQARCQHMLALQIAVRDGTEALDKVIQAYTDKKPTRAENQASNELSDKEHEIVLEAATAIRLIEADGSAVAFAEVFKQVHTDMQTVEGRLRKTDVGAVTVQIENDIIDTLKEMVEALKKARQENQAKQGQPKQGGGGGMPQDQKLIDLIAELKMIRSMQVRVNNRTEVYGKQYKGEQAPAATAGKTDQEREQYESVQRELKDLAGRQEKIGRVTHDIATGKNEAR